MSKNKKNRKNVVYSTNPDFGFEHEESEEKETLAPNEQRLTALLDRKMRKGKSVTIIADFVGRELDLKALGKTLKVKCAVGGAAKDGEIILQGDVREKAIKLLMELGYNVKRSGG
jgi:translation initiation factor 1